MILRAPDAAPWLKTVRLQVRPCGFSLKTYPIVAACYRLRATCCLIGVSIVLLSAGIKIRKSRPG